MEQFRDVLTLLFGIITLLYPLFFVPFVHRKQHVMIFTATTALLTGILCWTLLWWDDFSTWRLMEYYGWNPDGMCDTECFQNVAECEMERVQKLWNHNMGVGWPLKALLIYIVILPAQWILSAVEYFILKHLRAKRGIKA